jgi:hypothetical protein
MSLDPPAPIPAAIDVNEVANSFNCDVTYELHDRWVTYAVKGKGKGGPHGRPTIERRTLRKGLGVKGDAKGGRGRGGGGRGRGRGGRGKGKGKGKHHGGSDSDDDVEDAPTVVAVGGIVDGADIGAGLIAAAVAPDALDET